MACAVMKVERDRAEALRHTKPSEIFRKMGRLRGLCAHSLMEGLSMRATAEAKSFFALLLAMSTSPAFAALRCADLISFAHLDVDDKCKSQLFRN